MFPSHDSFTILDDPNQGIFLFKKIDGMYSVCYDKDEQLIHLAAWTEVQIVRPVKTYTGNIPNYVPAST